MSSTQMDFSPTTLDRKQDITSWPEGEITGLTSKDQNRYQKRRAAIREYFQSELSIEEISTRHRLAPSDSLATLASRCLMRHEDGRPWGFRALVPGVRVVNYAVPAEVNSAGEAEARAETPEQDEPEMFELDESDADDATAERPAIRPPSATVLPETPRPESTEHASEPEVETSEVEESAVEPEVETNESVESVVEPEIETNEVEESAGESEIEASAVEPEKPAAATRKEDLASSLAQEFAASTRAIEIESVEEEVEQQEFPTPPEVEEPREDEVRQEEFPEATSAVAEQEEPRATINEIEAAEAASAVEQTADEEVKQAEFPPATNASEPQEEPRAVVSESEPSREDEVRQEELPETASAAAELEEDEESAVAEHTGVENAVAEPEASSRLYTRDGEEASSENDRQELETPITSSLPATKPACRAASLPPAPADPDPQAGDEESTTQKLVREEEAKPQAVEKQEEMADLDTVEVAKVEAEEKRERVAAADTIVVPAAMLDALEKADQELPTEAGEPDVDVDVEVVPTRALARPGRLSQPLPTQPLVEEGRYRITGSQVALKHAVFRRWSKQGKALRHRRWVKIVSAAVIASLVVGLAIPLCVGLMGYSTYNNIKGVAYDGINNLLAIKNLIPANKNDLTSVLNTQKLTEAQSSLSKAQSDFLQLQDLVNRPDVQSLLQQFAPQYSGELNMGRRLVQVALDVSRMGQEMIGVAQMGANILHGGALLSSSNKPLLTADDVNSVEAALVHAQYYINDIQTQMSQVNLAKMPFGSAAQKAELAKYLGEIPQAQGTITQVQSLVGPIAWLLGVGSTRNFLVQTLDRGELRPSGGFEGQYGVVTINNGRLGSVTLQDIAELDYGNNGNELGNHPPAQYKWMDFGNFGVRDANLSADYPTTARMVMQLFQQEGGGPVDGDIQITPVVIEQLLQLTGPLYVKEYNETITPQNLEDKLHLYQQNYNYISIEAAKTGSYTHTTRKAFTALVGQMLLDRAKHLTTTQLLSLGKTLFKDFKSRDLQVYFNNPVVEQWLTTNGDSGAMPQFVNGTDGFMVVQANISISKAAQFVHSTFNDQVTLNGDGSATHNLTITLAYDQTGPVYGYDTYADYMRVYAPANAQFNSGYGFVSNHALCTPGGKDTTGSGGNGGGGNGGGGTPPPPGKGTGKTTGCTQYNNSFPDENARYCPNGVYTLGMDGMTAKPYPIDSLGGPTETSSDLPGYQMWGGLTLTPKNCTSTISLTWTVPHAVQNKLGQPPYQIMVGHQAGWPDTVQVAVDASALKGVKNYSFNGVISVDTLLALPSRPLPPSQKKPAAPTPAVTPTATRRP